MKDNDLPTSYLVIQIVSVFLVIASFFTSAPYGAVFWCVVVWMMLRRKFETLKFLMSIGLVIVLIGLFAAIYMYQDVPYSEEIDHEGLYFLLFLFGLMALYLFYLRNYFHRLEIAKSTLKDVSAVIKQTDSAKLYDENAFYEQAYEEALGVNIHVALWARCLVAANGDDGAAKAAYIKERVEQLSNSMALAEQRGCGVVEQLGTQEAKSVAGKDDEQVKIFALSISYLMLGIAGVLGVLAIVYAGSLWALKPSAEELEKDYILHGLTVGARTELVCSGDDNNSFNVVLERDLVYISKNRSLLDGAALEPGKITTKLPKLLVFDGKARDVKTNRVILYSGAISGVDGRGNITINNWLGSKYTFSCRNL